MQIPNPKSQIPNKFQIPNTNIQEFHSTMMMVFRIWFLGFVWILVLGAWFFFTQ